MTADPFLHPGHDQHAENNGQNSASPAPEHGVKRRALIPPADRLRDQVDPVETGDHTQHSAQDRRSAEPLRGAVARPCGQIGEKGGVDQSQHRTNNAQESVVRPAGI